MKKIIYSTIILALTLGFSGCAGAIKHMSPAAEGQNIATPTNGKAQIVFMRPSSYGYAIQSSVFEIKNEKPSIVGIIPAKKKVAYEVEPGEHLFMVVGESADFMKATVAANKTYYAMVIPRMGLWKARFSLKALNKNDEEQKDLTEWLKDSQLLVPSADTEKWASENAKDIEEKYKEYYKKWISKDASERPALLEEDGQ